jgi:hypothetical protein
LGADVRGQEAVGQLSVMGGYPSELPDTTFKEIGHHSLLLKSPLEEGNLLYRKLWLIIV